MKNKKKKKKLGCLVFFFATKLYVIEYASTFVILDDIVAVNQEALAH